MFKKFFITLFLVLFTCLSFSQTPGTTRRVFADSLFIKNGNVYIRFTIQSLQDIIDARVATASAEDLNYEIVVDSINTTGGLTSEALTGPLGDFTVPSPLSASGGSITITAGVTATDLSFNFEDLNDSLNMKAGLKASAMTNFADWVDSMGVNDSIYAVLYDWNQSWSFVLDSMDMVTDSTFVLMYTSRQMTVDSIIVVGNPDHDENTSCNVTLQFFYGKDISQEGTGAPAASLNATSNSTGTKFNTDEQLPRHNFVWVNFVDKTSIPKRLFITFIGTDDAEIGGEPHP